MPFQHGAVALLDALGFKGIWRDNDPDRVLQKLGEFSTELVQAAEESSQRLQATSKDHDVPLPQFKIFFVSDSVFVACWWEGADPEDEERYDEQISETIMLASMLSSVLSFAAVQHPPPLAYRGVVTCGEFAVHETGAFVVGPAVDEVAALEREAEGAFVWLTPRARRTIEGQRETFPHLLVPYAVPMKGGRYLETMVVTPMYASQPEQYPRNPGAFLGNLFFFAMRGDSLDVAVKRQNTWDFYEETRPDAMMSLDRLLDATDSDLVAPFVPNQETAAAARKSTTKKQEITKSEHPKKEDAEKKDAKKKDAKKKAAKKKAAKKKAAKKKAAKKKDAGNKDAKKKDAKKKAAKKKDAGNKDAGHKDAKKKAAKKKAAKKKAAKQRAH